MKQHEIKVTVQVFPNEDQSEVFPTFYTVCVYDHGVLIGLGNQVWLQNAVDEALNGLRGKLLFSQIIGLGSEVGEHLDRHSHAIGFYTVHPFLPDFRSETSHLQALSL